MQIWRRRQRRAGTRRGLAASAFGWTAIPGIVRAAVRRLTR